MNPHEKTAIWSAVERVATRLRQTAKTRNMLTLKQEVNELAAYWAVLQGSLLSKDLRRLIMSVIITNESDFDLKTGKNREGDPVLKDGVRTTLGVIMDTLDTEFEPFPGFKPELVVDELTALIAVNSASRDAGLFISLDDWSWFLTTIQGFSKDRQRWLETFVCMLADGSLRRKT